MDATDMIFVNVLSRTGFSYGWLQVIISTHREVITLSHEMLGYMRILGQYKLDNKVDVVGKPFHLLWTAPLRAVSAF